MKNVGDWLKDADPVAGTASRSQDDVARLRAATLKAADLNKPKPEYEKLSPVFGAGA